MKKRKLIFKISLCVFCLFLALASATIRMSRASRDEFEVRGVDVSAYQGEIDWQELASNDIDFAFIKASEGSSYRDRFFRENIKAVKETSLAPGAYHFMSFESSGRSQAQNFISCVSPEDISLPPVIDVELYGEYKNNPPPATEVREILDSLISELYVQYGRMPMIYTNRRAYSLYISGEYKNCDIWICDVVKRPTLPDGRKWTFWQYSHTERLSGYSGEEEFIDMNVFNGSKSEFLKYIQ